MAFLASYFMNRELSGIDIVVRVTQTHGIAVAEPADAAPPAKSTRSLVRRSDNDAAHEASQLAVLPGHRVVLFNSGFFKAQQAQHWQTPPTPPTSKRQKCEGSAAAAERPSVQLTIDSAEQLPAAEAVIAAMYGVPEALSRLEQQQLVHAVVIADMVGAAAAAQQAVTALTSAAQSEQGLSAAALQALAGLTAWPACLLQMLPGIVQRAPCCSDSASDLAAITAADTGGRVQQLLLAAFGDLEAVWADAQLKALLLSLPLPALQLLLSSDQLLVASEDTVLFTAQQYVLHLVKAHSSYLSTVRALRQLVRAPQLSLPALAAAALQQADSSTVLLKVYQQHLRKLLSLRHIAAAEQLAGAVKDIADAPASWQLGPRQIRPLEGGVRLEWQLPVQQLRQACRDSVTQQKAKDLLSPESSPPMAGLAWQLKIKCIQQGGGTVVGLYVQPQTPQPGVFYRCKCTFQWRGVTQSASGTPTLRSRGFPDFFDLQPMAAGGWDEAAWAAKGLPTSGDMLLQLHAHSVN